MINDLRKVVEMGTSGGISLVGTLAALAGSALIASLAVLFPADNLSLNLWDWTFITFSGLLGSLFNSLLGATVQAIYYCPADRKETERHPLHLCGAETVHLRGWKWLTNDWVNFACAGHGGFAGDRHPCTMTFPPITRRAKHIIYCCYESDILLRRDLSLNGEDGKGAIPHQLREGSMRTINLQTWSRREHFKFFNSFDHPHFSLCANVDITHFHAYTRQNNISILNWLFVYIITRVANSIPEFRYRIRQDSIIEHDVVHPSYTILVKDDLFTFCTLDYKERFPDFASQAAKKYRL